LLLPFLARLAFPYSLGSFFQKQFELALTSFFFCQGLTGGWCTISLLRGFRKLYQPVVLGSPPKQHVYPVTPARFTSGRPPCLYCATWNLFLNFSAAEEMETVLPNKGFLPPHQPHFGPPANLHFGQEGYPESYLFSLTLSFHSPPPPPCCFYRWPFIYKTLLSPIRFGPKGGFGPNWWRSLTEFIFGFTTVRVTNR